MMLFGGGIIGEFHLKTSRIGTSMPDRMIEADTFIVFKTRVNEHLKNHGFGP